MKKKKEALNAALSSPENDARHIKQKKPIGGKEADSSGSVWEIGTWGFFMLQQGNEEEQTISLY